VGGWVVVGGGFLGGSPTLKSFLLKWFTFASLPLRRKLMRGVRRVHGPSAGEVPFARLKVADIGLFSQSRPSVLLLKEQRDQGRGSAFREKFREKLCRGAMSRRSERNFKYQKNP